MKQSNRKPRACAHGDDPGALNRTLSLEDLLQMQSM